MKQKRDNKFLMLIITSATAMIFMGLITQTTRAQGTVTTAPRKQPAPVADSTIARLKASIEKNPDDLASHQAYIKAVGIESATVNNQYEKWMKQFPKSATVPFAIGEGYYNRESPRAKPYLMKATSLNPKLSQAFLDLSFDAERWGDNDAARNFMGKATAADPSDPSPAFYYAMDFEESDPAQWRIMLYDLAKRFPAHERGAQGLYWLAARSTDTTEKVKVYEQLRSLYPPAKFTWSSSGMSGLFDLYLTIAPDKALALAKSMGTENGWPKQAELAQNVIQVRSLMASQKYAEATSLANGIKASRYSSSGDMIALLKAEIADAAGSAQPAYDSLLIVFARAPGDELYAGLQKYGKKLGKNAAQIDADVWKLRDATATAAPFFDLALYTSKKTASLNDFKGKVVLLTFWFPGCGPCRGEFPHFETVLSKFKGKNVSYVGINVDTTQDAYVLPFMEGTKYSFTPLRGNGEWAAATYKVRGEPTNFLIDQQGRIVFTNFRASDPYNERSLELMIKSMLDHGANSTVKAGTIAK